MLNTTRNQKMKIETSMVTWPREYYLYKGL